MYHPTIQKSNLPVYSDRPLQLLDMHNLTIQKSNLLDYIDRPSQILEMYCLTIQKSNLPGVSTLGFEIIYPLHKALVLIYLSHSLNT